MEARYETIMEEYVKTLAIESLTMSAMVRQDVIPAVSGYVASLAQAVSAKRAAVEGLPCPELLSLTLNSLHALDRLQSIPPLQVKTAFEWRALCLAGYEPAVDLCPCCAASPPEEPRFHILEGTVHCARCRDRLGGGISMPLSPQALSALQYIVHGDPKRLFSFHLDPASLKLLGDAAEGYLHAQLERGFSTLDYYKALNLPT